MQKRINVLQKLSEAFFVFSADVDDKTLVRFVKNSKRLNTLQFVQVIANPEELKQRLDESLGNEFDIRFLENEYGFLQRTKFNITRKIPVELNNATRNVSYSQIITSALVLIGHSLFAYY